MRWHSALIAGVISTASVASGALIGSDQFNYTPNGTNLIGKNGGTGFDWESFPETHTNGVSSWDRNYNEGTDPYVSNGQAYTQANSGLRTWGENRDNGAYNRGGLTDNRVLFLSALMTYTGSLSWGGLSAMDFAGEPVKWGATDSGGNWYFGIDQGGGFGGTHSGIQITSGQTYRVVGKLDFANDITSLWIDPTLADEASPDQTRTSGFPGGNWITGLRIGSGNQVAWDDVRVGTTFGDVVPEPATLSLLALGALALRRRR